MSNDKNYWEYFITLGFAISLIISIAAGWLRINKLLVIITISVKDMTVLFLEDDMACRRTRNSLTNNFSAFNL